METMHSSFLFKRLVACILSENTYFELQPRNKKQKKNKVEAREERPILSRSSALLWCHLKETIWHAYGLILEFSVFIKKKKKRKWASHFSETKY